MATAHLSLLLTGEPGDCVWPKVHPADLQKGSAK